MAFLSGAAALIYELTWAKMLALTFGSTTLSAAAVIAGFMGGMGLGARSYHLLAKCVHKPLAAYAGLELAIAISSAALTLTFYSLPQAFGTLAQSLDNPFILAFLRFLSVIALLLIPSALMGATFPALCAVLIRSAPMLDGRLGWIYGINTIGGAAGVALGGLVLIDQFGLSTTVHIANAINVAIFLAALTLLKTQWGAKRTNQNLETETAIPTTLPQGLTGAVLLVSGFTTLAYEIMWFRAVRFYVGNSTHALGTVLLLFLAGLGIGSLLFRPVIKRGRVERSLALVQCGIAVLALWAMACMSLVLTHESIYPHVSIFFPQVRFQPWAIRLAVVAMVSVVTMLPGAILMGLSFPLASRMYIGDVRKLDSNIGAAYLLANMGSIFGSIVAASLLLPTLGVVGGTKLCAVANLLLGVVILGRLRKIQSGWIVPVGFCGVLAGVLFMVLPPRLGLFGEQSQGKPVFYEEADMGTVQVVQTTDDPDSRVMLVDGTRIGCGKGLFDSAMYFKQLMLAHLPLALDPQVKTTLNIGLGSGSTLETIVGYPQIEKIDCVEINPAVVRGSGAFSEIKALDDPRVHLVVDDAVHYLLRTKTRYDLIISDGKQDPFYSGNATLLCRDYYQYARNALTDRGLFIHWIPLRTLHDDFAIILGSLDDVFDYVEVFVEPNESLIMVASKKPILSRPHARDADIHPQESFGHLRPFGMNGVDAILSQWVAGKPQFSKRLIGRRRSTWDHLILDYSAFRADKKSWQRAALENLKFLREAGDVPRKQLPPVFDPGVNPYMASSRLVRRAFEYLLAKDPADALDAAEQAVLANPSDVRAVEMRSVAVRISESMKNRADTGSE